MLEVIVLLITACLLVWGGLALWRSIQGEAGRPWGVIGRIVLLSLIIMPLVAFTAWRNSKSRRFQFFGGLVTHVATDEPVIALTFDDGPIPG